MIYIFGIGQFNIELCYILSIIKSLFINLFQFFYSQTSSNISQMKSKTAQLILQKQSDQLKTKTKNVISEKSKLDYCTLFSFVQRPYKNQITIANQEKVQELQGQYKLLEKQNFRLIQANVDLLKQSLYMAEQIKENLLTAILHIQQYHYVETNKYLYAMLQKISNFISAKQCPGRLSSLRKSHISKKNQTMYQVFPDKVSVLINQQGNPQSTPLIRAHKKIPKLFIQNSVDFLYQPPIPHKHLVQQQAQFKQLYGQQSQQPISLLNSQNSKKEFFESHVIQTHPIIEQKYNTARQNRKNSCSSDRKQEQTIATSREKQIKISINKDKSKHNNQLTDNMYYLLLSQALSLQSLLK